ncbi:uncharacterized protein LOC114522692 [Dendronephthya gigantea]|uniref:uncharacterized protein LOC114522692 n=1 Tax=Dendronephthya gigantea TaxID=151771 RepID=UPI00106D91E7|nr:uncharacterized protein LOC114522692 [Dendronephthya gigantea]
MKLKCFHWKTRTKFMVIIFTIWLLQAAWLGFYFRSEGNRVQNVNTLYEDLSESHISEETLKESLGKLLKVHHEETTIEETTTLKLVLEISDVTFPRAVNTAEKSGSNSESSPKKYAYVIGRYWEQMTQSMRAFLALVLQASSSGRSVVATMVKDSRFQTFGYPIDYYFDRSQIREILRTNGYPDIVDKEEFQRECPPESPNHTSVHFLYDQEKAATYTKNLFKLDDATYANVSRQARNRGWARCNFMQKLTKQTSRSEMLCVDTTVVTDWEVFERDVIKSPRCLNIVLWRGIGESFRARFKEDRLKLYSRDFFISLKPSPDILREVEKFKREVFGYSKYIGVQIRGEHVAILHGLAFLKQCIHLLGYVLRLLKGFFGTERVFVATDMSQYGSKSWKDSVKRDNVTDETLPALQELVLSVTNGVTFARTADKKARLDRGLVALIEVTLVSQAESLLTIGHSSFHEWTSSKFLDFHRNESPAMWSLVKLCQF